MDSRALTGLGCGAGLEGAVDLGGLVDLGGEELQ